MRTTFITRLGGALTATGLAMVVSAGVGPGAPAGAVTEPDTTLSSGDVTVPGVRLDGDALALRVGSAAPEDVLLRVGPGAATAVPADPVFAFLGSTGKRVWVLSEADAVRAVRPVSDTTGVPADRLAEPAVNWRLLGVAGPGAFQVFTVPVPHRPEVIFNSADGLPDSHALKPASRGHTSWAFAAAGSYQLTFEVETTLSGGKHVTSTATYLVEVVAPAEPSAPPSSSVTVTTPPSPAPDLGQPAAKVAQTPAPAQANIAAAETFVLADGHCDVSARLVDGALRIEIGDETTGTHRFLDVEQTVLHARPASKIENGVPDNPAFNFLGNPGDPIWILPQVQQDGILWPGWNTQAIPQGELTGPVAWKLVSVNAPGGFWLFTVDEFGNPNVLFNSADGLPDTLNVPTGTHAHGNWAFNKTGVYRLTFEMSATTKDGQAVTDRATLAIAVGDIDPGTVIPGDGNPGTDPTSTTSTSTTSSTATAANAAGGGGSGRLPNTGVSMVLPLSAGGIALLGGGAVLVLVGRRRRAGRTP